jgi:hypothetical protein
MLNAFREICAVSIEDGIEFDVAALRVDQIREELEYGGSESGRSRLLAARVSTSSSTLASAVPSNLRSRKPSFQSCSTYRCLACAGITGSPEESGTLPRKKGLSKPGNARVRRGMIQLAWRWLSGRRRAR